MQFHVSMIPQGKLKHEEKYLPNNFFHGMKAVSHLFTMKKECQNEP